MTANDTGVGVVFPLVDGRRSTSATGRAVVADAVRDVDPTLAATVEAEQDWRRGYIPALHRLTGLYVTSPAVAYGVARRGLASAGDRFRFVREEAESTLAEAASGPTGQPFDTVEIHGDPTARQAGLSVPYLGGHLAGDDLRRQLDRWVLNGIAEPSSAESIRAVMANPEWLDLQDLTVVLLGAGAEMGPFGPLLRWGAHVVAVDLPRQQIWARLVGEARKSAGRLSLPVRTALRDDAGDREVIASAGVDIVADLPEVRAWLASLPGPLTVGNYVYADGATHLRSAIAIDALMTALSRERGDVSLAFLSTPTDVFPVPADVVRDSRRRGEEASRWHRLLRGGSGGRLFSPNYPDVIAMDDGRSVGLCDALVSLQGPNYALAKRIQRWRAMVARSEGQLVSHNVAPASRTKSVLKNRILAAAYSGAHRFGVETFDPQTSNTLMAALLVHDLRNPAAAANPATSLHNPVELFWHGAIHGGLWRNPYAPRSVLAIAVLLGLLRRRRNSHDSGSTCPG